MAKKGKRFEDLVAWIEACLAPQAEVVPNAKLLDKDTGKSRQVDVGIFVEEGHHRLLIMVEVRDWSRPIGSPYIEQIHSKARSVGGNSVVIVSTSGFYAPAREKARVLGIRLLTYKEALADDWAKWAMFRTMTVYQRHFELRHANIIIDPSGGIDEVVKDALRRALPNLGNIKPFEVSRAEPCLGIIEIVKQALTHEHPVWEEVFASKQPIHRKLAINLTNDPPVMLVGKHFRVPVTSIKAHVELSIITQEVPLKLFRYSDNQTQEHISEVLSAVFETPDGSVQLDFMVKGAPEFVEAGEVIYLRASRPKDS